MKIFIGIDIGGTNTKIGLVAENGEICHFSRVYYPDAISTATEFFAKMNPVIEQTLSKAKGDVVGIGVSTPGLLTENRRGSQYSINLPFLSRFDIVGLLEDAFKIPVRLENDLVSNGLASYQFGEDRGNRRFLSVSMGTGIGHTFILDGKPVESMGGISGDSGRMILNPHAERKDSSGIFGTAEALCGVGMIEEMAEKIWKKEERKTAHDVIKMCRENHDLKAEKILGEIAYWLAIYLANLSSIYFPYVISISGGQTEAGDFFFETCQKEFDRLSANFFAPCHFYPNLGEKVIIKKSQAGGLAGLIGSIVSFIS